MDASPPLFPRSLASAVREALADTPVVCLLGARQSGKTTLARGLAPDRAFVSLDEHGCFETAGSDPPGFVAALSRDKDQAEVDVVVARGRQTWGVEVKAAGAVAPRDGRGLVRLADRGRGGFESGVVLYAGRDVLRPAPAGRAAEHAVGNAASDGPRAPASSASTPAATSSVQVGLVAPTREAIVTVEEEGPDAKRARPSIR